MDKVFSKESPLDFILEKVPRSIQSKIKMCRSMNEVWTHLDEEFGQSEEVAARCIRGLISLSLKERTDDGQFLALYDKYMEVRHDLIEVEE